MDNVPNYLPSWVRYPEEISVGATASMQIAHTESLLFTSFY